MAHHSFHSRCISPSPIDFPTQASLLEYLSERSFIVQPYVQNPVLYDGRKCDFRQYMMFGTTASGRFFSFFHSLGHGRVSAKPYNKEDLSDKEIHATNLNIDIAGGGYKSQDFLAGKLVEGSPEMQKRVAESSIGTKGTCSNVGKQSPVCLIHAVRTRHAISSLSRRCSELVHVTEWMASYCPTPA
jgi:hypothetical protein